MRAISLFSGAGGFELGFFQAGIETVLQAECERLMGWPSNWTEGLPDAHRYRLCGNGVVAPGRGVDRPPPGRGRPQPVVGIGGRSRHPLCGGVRLVAEQWSSGPVVQSSDGDMGVGVCLHTPPLLAPSGVPGRDAWGGVLKPKACGAEALGTTHPRVSEEGLRMPPARRAAETSEPSTWGGTAGSEAHDTRRRARPR
jgi:hypothetical protein